MQLHLKPGQALVVVAHPDDETIWMGGTILTHKRVRWTIYALCKKSDPDRVSRFRHAMKALGARGIISDLEDDDDRMSIKELSRRAEKLIMRELPQKSFDYIFTHARDGEYGNLRHKGVHRAVKDLLQAKQLQAKKLYYFSYEMHKSDKYATPQKSANFEIKLSKPVFDKKLKIIQDIYGFQPDSFEHRSCHRIEKFNSM